jgi:hypothetical protein
VGVKVVFAERKGREMHRFSLFLLFVYYVLLRTDFTEYVFRDVFCAARSFPTTVLVLPALQERSRQQFL